MGCRGGSLAVCAWVQGVARVRAFSRTSGGGCATVGVRRLSAQATGGETCGGVL